jgi:hypothetical protein
MRSATSRAQAGLWWRTPTMWGAFILGNRERL